MTPVSTGRREPILPFRGHLSPKRAGDWLREMLEERQRNEGGLSEMNQETLEEDPIVAGIVAKY